MPNEIAVQKLVLEWRYSPSLEFYSKMDSIGGHFANQFKDWERSPLTIEVQDRKSHRRCFLTYRRSFFEADNPNSHVSEVLAGEGFLKRTMHELSLTELSRVGLRYWFAIDIDLTFPALAERLHDRFYAGKKISDLLGSKVADLAYVTYFEHDKGWKFNVRLGPMERDQWFREFVQYERTMYEASDGPDSISGVRDRLPEQFLYVDLDYYKEHVNSVDVPGLLVEFRKHSQETVNKIAEYCKVKS